MDAPGAVTERMVVLFPMLVEKSRSACSLQGGVYHPDGSPPAFSRTGKCCYYRSAGVRYKGDMLNKSPYLDTGSVGRHDDVRLFWGTLNPSTAYWMLFEV